MGLELEYNDGQTPLDPDEKEGLLIKTLTTHGELDEYEQLNIEKAVEWTLRRNFKAKSIFTENFVRSVHSKMFGDVWKWAGKFRQTEKNIGIDPISIGVELKNLLDDIKFWVENEIYPPNEITIRFKHRLVAIHCFPNGNGRHSRLMADIIIESVFGEEVFSWNNSNMGKPDETRKNYIEAIQKADAGDILPLLKFARN